MSRLRASGIAVAMVTGDDPGVAARVAGEAGIVDIRPRVTPEGKREEVAGRGNSPVPSSSSATA